MSVMYTEIGALNMALVAALKKGLPTASGYPISDYLHDKTYNYDLSFGLMAIAGNRMLSGTYIGIKYYCYNKEGRDMAKRIVHIKDPKNPGSPQSFYRLIHTAAAPGLRDNSYGACDLITNIP